MSTAPITFRPVRDLTTARIATRAIRSTTAAEYRDARDAWELLAEDATSLYATELAEYRVTHPAPRFADFLRGSAR